jgi:hypothetical protein
VKGRHVIHGHLQKERRDEWLMTWQLNNEHKERTNGHPLLPRSTTLFQIPAENPEIQ